jgi:hypothetical protein
MPHTRKRGKRNLTTYKRKLAQKATEQSLREQRSFSSQIVRDNAFHDRINGETVNILAQSEIIRQVTTIYPDAPPQAIPTVQDGSVLNVPNVYHLELFPEQKPHRSIEYVEV